MSRSPSLVPGQQGESDVTPAFDALLASVGPPPSATSVDKGVVCGPRVRSTLYTRPQPYIADLPSPAPSLTAAADPENATAPASGSACTRAFQPSSTLYSRNRAMKNSMSVAVEVGPEPETAVPSPTPDPSQSSFSAVSADDESSAPSAPQQQRSLPPTHPQLLSPVLAYCAHLRGEEAESPRGDSPQSSSSLLRPWCRSPTVFVSPSRIAAFPVRPWEARLDLLAAMDPRLKAARDGAPVEVKPPSDGSKAAEEPENHLFVRGLRHEAFILDKLSQHTAAVWGRSQTPSPKEADDTAPVRAFTDLTLSNLSAPARAQETLAAIARGDPLLFQGCLRGEVWRRGGDAHSTEAGALHSAGTGEGYGVFCDGMYSTEAGLGQSALLGHSTEAGATQPDAAPLRKLGALVKSASDTPGASQCGPFEPIESVQSQGFFDFMVRVPLRAVNDRERARCLRVHLNTPEDDEIVYDIWDAKLASEPKPEAILQIAHYAHLLLQSARLKLQSAPPNGPPLGGLARLRLRDGVIALGSGRLYRFPLTSVMGYLALVHTAFAAAADATHPSLPPPPLPAAETAWGHWSGLARWLLKTADSPTSIAHVTSRIASTMASAAPAPVTTAAQLAEVGRVSNASRVVYVPVAALCAALEPCRSSTKTWLEQALGPAAPAAALGGASPLGGPLKGYIPARLGWVLSAVQAALQPRTEKTDDGPRPPEPGSPAAYWADMALPRATRCELKKARRGGGSNNSNEVEAKETNDDGDEEDGFGDEDGTGEKIMGLEPALAQKVALQAALQALARGMNEAVQARLKRALISAAGPSKDESELIFLVGESRAQEYLAHVRSAGLPSEKALAEIDAIASAFSAPPPFSLTDPFVSVAAARGREGAAKERLDFAWLESVGLGLGDGPLPAVANAAVSDTEGAAGLAKLPPQCTASSAAKPSTWIGDAYYDLEGAPLFCPSLDDIALAERQGRAAVQGQTGSQSPTTDGNFSPFRGVTGAPKTEKIDYLSGVVVEGSFDTVDAAAAAARADGAQSLDAEGGRGLTFIDWWAHSRGQEQGAFTGSLQFLGALARTRAEDCDPAQPHVYPHVYHYAPYEPAALRRMASKFGCGASEVSSLTRAPSVEDGGVFIDVYPIVAKSLAFGEPKLSLKNVEKVLSAAADSEAAEGERSAPLLGWWARTVAFDRGNLSPTDPEASPTSSPSAPEQLSSPTVTTSTLTIAGAALGRSGSVATALDSVAAYDDWLRGYLRALRSGDSATLAALSAAAGGNGVPEEGSRVDWRLHKALEEIRSYNIADCVNLRAVVLWLRELRDKQVEALSTTSDEASETRQQRAEACRRLTFYPHQSLLPSPVVTGTLSWPEIPLKMSKTQKQEAATATIAAKLDDVSSRFPVTPSPAASAALGLPPSPAPTTTALAAAVLSGPDSFSSGGKVTPAAAARAAPLLRLAFHLLSVLPARGRALPPAIAAVVASTFCKDPPFEAEISSQATTPVTVGGVSVCSDLAAVARTLSDASTFYARERRAARALLARLRPQSHADLEPSQDVLAGLVRPSARVLRPTGKGERLSAAAAAAAEAAEGAAEAGAGDAWASAVAAALVEEETGGIKALCRVKLSVADESPGNDDEGDTDDNIEVTYDPSLVTKPSPVTYLYRFDPSQPFPSDLSKAMVSSSDDNSQWRVLIPRKAPPSVTAVHAPGVYLSVTRILLPPLDPSKGRHGWAWLSLSAPSQKRALQAEYRRRLHSTEAGSEFPEMRVKLSEALPRVLTLLPSENVPTVALEAAVVAGAAGMLAAVAAESAAAAVAVARGGPQTPVTVSLPPHSLPQALEALLLRHIPQPLLPAELPFPIIDSPLSAPLDAAPLLPAAVAAQGGPALAAALAVLLRREAAVPAHGQLGCEGSVLVVQGPPGTGKTTLLSAAIAGALASGSVTHAASAGARGLSHAHKQGFRVGVVAHAHLAVDGLVAGVLDAADTGTRALFASPASSTDVSIADVSMSVAEAAAKAPMSPVAGLRVQSDKLGRHLEPWETGNDHLPTVPRTGTKAAAEQAASHAAVVAGLVGRTGDEVEEGDDEEKAAAALAAFVAAAAMPSGKKQPSSTAVAPASQQDGVSMNLQSAFSAVASSTDLKSDSTSKKEVSSSEGRAAPSIHAVTAVTSTNLLRSLSATPLLMGPESTPVRALVGSPVVGKGMQAAWQKLTSSPRGGPHAQLRLHRGTYNLIGSTVWALAGWTVSSGKRPPSARLSPPISAARSALAWGPIAWQRAASAGAAGDVIGPVADAPPATPLRRAKSVAASLPSVGDDFPLDEGCPLDVLIVEEAGQLPLPFLVAALAAGVARRVVMLGDHKQLAAPIAAKGDPSAADSDDGDASGGGHPRGAGGSALEWAVRGSARVRVPARDSWVDAIVLDESLPSSSAGLSKAAGSPGTLLDTAHALAPTALQSPELSNALSPTPSHSVKPESFPSAHATGLSPALARLYGLDSPADSPAPSVVPPSRGVFLPRSHRLPPVLCEIVSQAFYDGKLVSAQRSPVSVTLAQGTGDGWEPPQGWQLPQQGLVSVLWRPPVVEESAQQEEEDAVSDWVSGSISSLSLGGDGADLSGSLSAKGHTPRECPSEAAVVVSLVQAVLARGRVTVASSEVTVGSPSEAGARTRALEARDIMVVSPYNVQVNLIQSLLASTAASDATEAAALAAGAAPEDAARAGAAVGRVPVGTVDKFQGQQAPVVIFSTALRASPTEKDVEFVLDPRRTNVALSRAQALVLIVAPAKLVEGAGIGDVSGNKGAGVAGIEKMSLLAALLKPGMPIPTQ